MTVETNQDQLDVQAESIEGAINEVEDSVEEVTPPLLSDDASEGSEEEEIEADDATEDSSEEAADEDAESDEADDSEATD
jgi:hypothetical protein